MRRLVIYITPGHASVSVENGIKRETTAPTVSEVIDGMGEADRSEFVGFCNAVVEYATEQKPQNITELQKRIDSSK